MDSERNGRSKHTGKLQPPQSVLNITCALEKDMLFTAIGLPDLENKLEVVTSGKRKWEGPIIWLINGRS